MLELDVVGTKDNIVVVSHDSNMHRLTGHNLEMSNLQYSELPPYKKSFFSHFLEENFQCDREYHYTTLESVFANFPHNYISVDIKSPTENIILEVKRLTSQYNREKITFIGSGAKKNNDLVRKHINNTLTFMTLEKVLLIYFSYIFGLVGFIPITENSICLPIMTRTFEKLKYSELPYFKAFIYSSLSKFFAMISGPLNRHLNRRGVKVFYWTLNTEDEFDYAIKLNCHGIITDRPSLLKSYLISRSL
ncbi:hypothetical protein SteCoe_29053 [Stentor coeruleus]|uniref:GP-PDE domain-containing protein n=1 Tax=Stentor coeruleus TaxID=5963 RepID=A0A1R2B6T6_9CILI|nr:hypothetical protein SteCoe_29053 [Stentor coeruleus]